MLTLHYAAALIGKRDRPSMSDLSVDRFIQLGRSGTQHAGSPGNRSPVGSLGFGLWERRPKSSALAVVIYGPGLSEGSNKSTRITNRAAEC